jgi:ADP-ribosylglycohydrolase
MLHRDLLPDLLLRTEMVQRRDEGYDLGDLPQQIEAAIAAGTIEAQADANAYSYADAFWTELDALPLPPAERREPSDLEAIRAARPDGPRRYAVSLSDAAFYDHIYGAWLGRCAGCTLGKPVEGWPRVKIEAYLRAADAYPLSSYFPVLDPFPEGLALWDNYKRTALGNVKGMTRDDDIDYTVLALHILETYGHDFSTQDVALAWISNLPFYKVYTAEAVAYRNLINGLQPPHTAGYRNPYREWLGAQIRADLWGYVNPGHPERAAEFAHRDASLSHTGNGIYGAVWAAACLATAFATDDLRQIIAAGLAEILADCRLAQAVRDTVAWAGECPAWEDAWERVNDRYGGYHTIHVINNTCAIVLGLLYGEGDLEKSICLAVMGGWDTDCTGATVGSIVGAMRGAGALPEKWIGPLDDRLESIVLGFHDSRISDLARRTVALADLGGPP